MFEMFRKYLKELSDDTFTKHNLYRVSPAEIAEAESRIFIPHELKIFYQEIGYGFFHRGFDSANRLFSPLQFKQINLREDYYPLDPELDSYQERYKGEKNLFMEINDGLYLAIEKVDVEGKNAVYLFDSKIAGSLLDFLIAYDNDPGLFEDYQ